MNYFLEALISKTCGYFRTVLELLAKCLYSSKASTLLSFFLSPSQVESTSLVSETTKMKDSCGETQNVDIRQRGLMQFGCKHYRRRCMKKAQCCEKFFWCRHCHNETVEAAEYEHFVSSPGCRSNEGPHTMDRFGVQVVKCALCETEQPPAQVCITCGVNMGEYFCSICRFYDDDEEKKHFHCEKCGICRVDGKENFFHCDKCGCCIRESVKATHACVEQSLHQNCPICCEYLFDSVAKVTILPCLHPMHVNCLNAMMDLGKAKCPICSKTILQDMSAYWKELDAEADRIREEDPDWEHAPMVEIHCNDCNTASTTQQNAMGLRCGIDDCNSYNTRRL